MDKLHPTMLEANLDKKWWRKILRTINYLCNLSPSLLTGKTAIKDCIEINPTCLTFILLNALHYPK